MLFITPSAAEYFKKRVAPNGFPLRLTREVKSDCGDLVHKFEEGATRSGYDTEIQQHGVWVLCNFDEHPEFLEATVDLFTFGEGKLAQSRIVVTPFGGELCGCGISARLPKKSEA